MKKNYVQCRKCKAKQSKTSPPGFYNDVEIRNGIEYKVVKECQCHLDWRLETERFSRFITNGFNAELFDISLFEDGVVKDYKGNSTEKLKRISKYISNFDNPKVRETVLHFYGVPDTQKTVAAHWIGSKLIQKYTVQYATFITFFENYMKDIISEDDDNHRLKKYEECDLLILDNFKDNYSMKQAPFFHRFIQKRLNDGKGLILISSEPLKNFKDVILKDMIGKSIRKRNSEFLFNDIYNDIPEELF
jgi:DNA replication protein DnaC